MKDETTDITRPQDDVPHEVWLRHLLNAFRKNEKELEQLQAYARGLEEENVQIHKQMEELAEGGPRVFAENKRLKALLKVQAVVPMQLRHSKPIRTKYKFLQRYVEQLQNLLRANGIEFEEMKMPSDHPLAETSTVDLEEQMLQVWEEAIRKEVYDIRK